MNTEQTKQIAEAMTPTVKQWSQELLSYVQSSHDFAVQQVPLVAQEIITWGIASNVVVAVIALSVSVVFFKVAHAIYCAKDWDEVERIIGTGSFYCSSTMLFIFSIVTFYHAAQAYFCPRLYIIEYLANLLK